MNGDLGLSLVVIGVGVTVIGLIIIHSIPITILGASVVIIGMLAAWGEGSLEESILRLSSASWDNLALLLESLGTVSKAIYLPSSMVEDSTPCALIPQGGVMISGKLPRGFIIRYGSGPSDVGLRVRVMGSKAVEDCLKAGVVSNDVDSTLSNCIVNYLTLAKNVEYSASGNTISVMVNEPRVSNIYEGTIINIVLGSPMASIVASLVAESLNRPVTIINEEPRDNAILISLRVLTP